MHRSCRAVVGGRAAPETVKDLFKQEQAASEPSEEEIIEMQCDNLVTICHEVKFKF